MTTYSQLSLQLCVCGSLASFSPSSLIAEQQLWQYASSNRLTINTTTNFLILFCEITTSSNNNSFQQTSIVFQIKGLNPPGRLPLAGHTTGHPPMYHPARVILLFHFCWHFCKILLSLVAQKGWLAVNVTDVRTGECFLLPLCVADWLIYSAQKIECDFWHKVSQLGCRGSTFHPQTKPQM